MTTINSFKGDYAFLSNFHPCEIRFSYHLYDWIAKSAEQAYQACKTKKIPEITWIIEARHAGHAKIRGRDITLRPDWDRVKDRIMESIVREKFLEPNLAQLLLSTGDAILIERNHWHDNYWGDCGCKKCAKIKGQNRLGKILMKIREEMKGRTV